MFLKILSLFHLSPQSKTSKRQIDVEHSDFTRKKKRKYFDMVVNKNSEVDASAIDFNFP